MKSLMKNFHLFVQCKKECTAWNIAWVNLWRNVFVIIRMRRKVAKLTVPAIKKTVNWFAMECKLFGSKSSQWKRFIKKVFLKLSQNSNENTCARASFSIKLQTSACTWLWRRCFPVNFAKFLRTHFLENSFGWLLLQRVSLWW